MSNFSALIATIQANIKTNGQEEITGAILQDVLEAMVQALGTEAINNLESSVSTLSGTVSGIEGKIPSAATSSNKLADKAYVDAADTALTNAVNAIEDAIENGYVYAGIATPSGTPASGKVFYLALTAGTYTNYGGLVVTQGINILKYNGSAWSQEQLVKIDDELIAGSDGIIKNNAVAQSLFDKLYSLGVLSLTKLYPSYSSGYIKADGTVQSSQYGIHSDYVLIDNSKLYFVKGPMSTGWYVAYYTEQSEASCIGSQEYVNGTPAGFPLAIPSNAVYMRVTLQVGGDSVSSNTGLFAYTIRNIGNEIDSASLSDLISWLKNDVGFNIHEKCVVPASSMTSGYINQNGGVSTSSIAVCSDFIKLSTIKDYFVRSVCTNGWYYGYYSDANEGSFISAQQSSVSTTYIKDTILQIPHGAKYVRITSSTELYAGLYAYNINEIKYYLQLLLNNISTISESVGAIFTKVQSTLSSGYINKNGTISSSSYANYTDFIKIDEKYRFEYFIRTISSFNWCCAFYTSQSESSFIGCQFYDNENSLHDIHIVFPENAVYFRATLGTATGAGVYIRTFCEINDWVTDLCSDLENKLGTQYETLPKTLNSGYIKSDGTVGTSTYGQYTNFISINSYSDYIIRTMMTSGWYCAYYAESNEASFISSQAYQNDTSELVLNVPATAKYIRATIQIGGGDVLIKRLKPHLYSEYVVDKSGAGDFTTLYGALRALQNVPGHKKITVMGGVYDVFQEMGGQTFIDSIPSTAQPSDWRQYCTLIPDDTEIIGRGEVVVKCELPNDTPDYVKYLISPINVSGSAKIENMTIIAANVRYNIHDEGSQLAAYNKKYRIYKNVKIQQTSSITGTAYGCGFNPNCSFVFEDCIFEGDNLYQCVFMHTNNNNDYTTILMSNCVFNAGNSGTNGIYLHCGAHDNGNAFVTVQMNNVRSNKRVYVISGDYANTFKISAVGCNFNTVTFEGASNPYPAKFYE